MDIISTSENGKLSFGNYTLTEKQKKEDFPHCGDLYKIKTYNTMTKLEKNGMFVYESVPGTSVYNFTENADGVAFFVEGNADDDAQITVGLEDETEYEVIVDDVSVGKVHNVEWLCGSDLNGNLLNIKRFKLINFTGDPSGVVRNRNLGDCRIFRCTAFRRTPCQGKPRRSRPRHFDKISSFHNYL